MGLSTSSVILVGSNVAKNRVDLAKCYTSRNLEIAAMWAICAAILLLTLKYQFVNFFTDLEDIQELCYRAYYQFTLYVIGEVIEGSFAGIIRGLGFQAAGAVAPLIGYYVLGIPIICILTFAYNWSINGVWMGLNIGNIFIFSYFGTILWRTDWQRAVEQAEKRRRLEHGNAKL